jgi:hypothetical protein
MTFGTHLVLVALSAVHFCENTTVGLWQTSYIWEQRLAQISVYQMGNKSVLPVINISKN